MKTYFTFLLCIIIISGSVYCFSKEKPIVNNSIRMYAGSFDIKTGKKIIDNAISDTVYFGMWNGKSIIVDDYYKYNSNELLRDSTGGGYDKYSGDFKALLQKLGVYDEKKQEYYFDDFKPEFAEYTDIMKGDKIYISSIGGVYPAVVSGYYINLDDMVGSGSVFYATVNHPQGAKFEDYEIVVCSFNNNMSTLNRKGITNQQVINEFKGFLLSKLKGVKVSVYDDKGQKTEQPLTKIADDEIKVYEGGFTGKGKNEFLVSLTLRNDFTSFTSAIYIMDSEGKVIAELSPLAVNNFTYSKADAIVDMNGDGIMEVITDDGYYEGSGFNFHKYKNGMFEVLSTGFLWGV